MKTHSALTQKELDRLLHWLDPDRERAAEKYELIRAGLIRRFLNRHCVDAEGLADETINRVAVKVEELAGTYQGDPAIYFHGVAKKVLLEHHRDRYAEAKPPPPEPEPIFGDIYFECLERCLGKLSTERRDLILLYYSEMRQAKIDARKEMREQRNLKANALRAQTHRIRKNLGKCVRACVEQGGERNRMA
jgi:DNA-directed RNA polymerase specialized sigma24 family protein